VVVENEPDFDDTVDGEDILVFELDILFLVLISSFFI